MAKKKAPRKARRRDYTAKLLTRINKAHVPGAELQAYSEAVEANPRDPGEDIDTLIFIEGVKRFAGEPDKSIGAYFRMVAFAQLITEGKLPGWTRPADEEGAFMLHPALFDAAGSAPLYQNGKDFSFRRRPFLRLAFQLAKEMDD